MLICFWQIWFFLADWLFWRDFLFCTESAKDCCRYYFGSKLSCRNQYFVALTIVCSTLLDLPFLFFLLAWHWHPQSTQQFTKHPMGTSAYGRPQEPMPPAAPQATTLPYNPIVLSSISIGRPAGVFGIAALSRVSLCRDETDLWLCIMELISSWFSYYHNRTCQRCCQHDQYRCIIILLAAALIASKLPPTMQQLWR